MGRSILLPKHFRLAGAGSLWAAVQFSAGCQADLDSLPVGPAFTDEAEVRGLQFAAPAPPPAAGEWERACCGGGAALDDFDGDGDLDILLLAGFGDAALFVNDGAGGFSEGESNLPSMVRFARAAAAADFDGDGTTDVVVAGQTGVTLFVNRGALQFEATATPLAYTTPEFPAALSVSDLSGDGRLDVIVAMQSRQFREGREYRAPGHDRLLTFDRSLDPPWIDRSGVLGAWEGREAMTLVAGVDDFDSDGVLDLFLVRDHGDVSAGNKFLRGLPDGAFEDRSGAWGLDTHMDGMGLAVGDWDRDDRLDVVISDTDRTLAALSTDPEGSLDVAGAWGLQAPAGPAFETAWGVEAIDVEHDGDLDLVAAWGRQGVGTWEEAQGLSMWTWDDDRFIDASAGFEVEPQHMNRGVLHGDVDGDGFEDLLVTAWVGRPRLLMRAPEADEPPALRVQLAGPPGNRRGLGALIEVRDRGGHWQERRRLGSGTTSYGGSSPAEAWFGLGEREVADYVAVTWPDGSVTVVEDVAPGQTLVVPWGEGSVEPGR